MAKVDMLMPQMGESITEGTVIKWLKNEGESVQKDEILLEMSTDKVDSEIPAPHAGVVTKLLVNEGDVVQVGAVIAHIETDQEVQAAPATANQPQDTADQTPISSTPVEEPANEVQPILATSGSVDVVMPQMGESIAEGTVIRWLKKAGDNVTQDEILLEVSTDKVDSEIPSPYSGTILELLANEGETIAVGSVIAKIGTEVQSAEPSPTVSVTSVPPAQAVSTPQPVKQAPTPTPTPPPQPLMPVTSERTTNGERRFYSPLVRRIARAEGVSPQEMATIKGTGAKGRVTKRDIISYLDSRDVTVVTSVPSVPTSKTTPVTPVSPAVESKPVDAAQQDRVEVIPMNTMRKTIATHMVNSVKTSPHVFAVSEADMTELVNFRRANKEAFAQKAQTKLTYMPFITMACAKALQDFPLVNSSVDGSNIIRKKYINIGLAVALENNGLIVPVIKNADGLNVVGMARAINDLASRARSKKLKPDEVQDGTFSITNMGSFGSLMGLPIINQPQVAILGIGTIQKRPVVVDNAIAIRDMMYASLSFDHRIVDGALAGQFLDRVVHYLSNFNTDNIY